MMVRPPVCNQGLVPVCNQGLVPVGQPMTLTFSAWGPF